jgi:solute carrier family 45 protein 1/2/4
MAILLIFCREKSRLDLIRLSFIIIGIEFAYSAETAFASPLLLEIGVDHSQMTMAWVFSPLLGFFMSPLMGSVSDKCKLNYGRRRPFMLFMSVGILIGLMLIPYGQNVGSWLGDTGDSYTTAQFLNETTNLTYTSQFPIEGDKRVHVMNFKYSIIMVILGTVLLDINADASQIFARSYLIDVCLPCK